MSRVIIIQGSLNPESNTAKVVREAYERLLAQHISAEIIDLRELEMEFCDGRKISEYSNDLQQAYDRLSRAEAVIFGMPVYCYSVSGPLKNFIDITSHAMKNKYAGILCNAGSPFAYLASADLAKIMSFECHATVLQPVVKTSGADFEGGAIANEKILRKIDDLVAKLIAILSAGGNACSQQ